MGFVVTAIFLVVKGVGHGDKGTVTGIKGQASSGDIAGFVFVCLKDGIRSGSKVLNGYTCQLIFHGNDLTDMGL